MVNHQRRFRNYEERKIICDQIKDNLLSVGLTTSICNDLQNFFTIVAEFLHDDSGKSFQGRIILKNGLIQPLEIEYLLPGRRILQQYSRVKQSNN